MNEIIKAMEERRSIRKFQLTMPAKDDLAQIVEAGLYAASGMGKQSPKIIVLQKPKDIDRLERMNAAVMGKEDAHPFYGAPTVLVVLARADVSTCVEDGSLVIGNLMAAAHSLGVSSCWIHRAREEFASEEGKALLRQWGIEGDWVGVGHCILGYRAEPPRPAAPRKADYIVKI